MKTFIFIGPTLRAEEARPWLEAEYLPPVAQGDVASLLRFQPDVIGIIDGYFDQVPSVWHKEILLALSQGVTVVGAASMGALRAAELHPFGMVGIGRVFEWYRDGVIEADDEVAVRHAPAELEYLPVSEAMVNIRSTLEAACRQRVIPDSTRDALVQIGRDTPYWERSYPGLLSKGAQAGLPKEEMEGLNAYVSAHRVDQKKEDALALLRRVAAMRPDSRPRGTDFELQRTSYLARLLDMDEAVHAPGDGRVTIQELTDFARLEDPHFDELAQRAGRRRMLVDLARRSGVRVTEAEQAREWEDFRREQSLAAEAEVRDWSVRNGVTGEELTAFVEELALERKAQSLFGAPRNRDVLWQIRLDDKFGALREALDARNAAWETDARAGDVSAQELLAFYKQKTGHAQAQTLDEAARRLGFANKTALILELQKAYRLHPRARGR